MKTNISRNSIYCRIVELNKIGIKVIRFTNDQVLYNMDSVIKKILQEIAERTPL
jgi:very-short-patch-repair endonuclease